jgi:hypothetical protein
MNFGFPARYDALYAHHDVTDSLDNILSEEKC